MKVMAADVCFFGSIIKRSRTLMFPPDVQTTSMWDHQNIVMNNKLFLLGVSLLGLIPVAMIYNHLQPQQKPVDRARMLAIFRTMKYRYYPILKQVAFMFQRIRKETKLPEEEITDLIMGPQKPSSIMLRKIDREVLDSFKVSEEEFKQAYKYYKQEDVELGLLIEEMKQEIALASKGNLKEYKGPIPKSLTSEKTLRIFVQLIKIQMTEQIKIYKETVLQPQKSDLTEYDEIIESSGMDDYLASQDIDCEHEHPGKVVHQAIQNYFHKETSFRSKLLEMKAKFEAISNKVLAVKVTIRANKPINMQFLDSMVEEIQAVTLD